MPRHIAVPASGLYGLRPWTCSGIVELAQNPGVVGEQMQEDAFQALAATHPDFLPARSASQLKALSNDRRLP